MKIEKLGQKIYELSNHLGNVLSTISDRKIQASGTGGVVDYYLPDVRTMNDYYPFGMAMDGRTETQMGTEAYRFGFNGQEKVDQVYGDANAYDFGARLYDPRLGRWLSTDPLENINPDGTPYRYAKNTPLLFIDVEGNFEIKITEAAKKKFGLTELSITRMNKIVSNMQSYLKSNPAVLHILSEQTGYSTKEILENAGAGQGPVILIDYNTDINESQARGAFASNSHMQKGEFVFDGSLIKSFEEMKFENEDEENAYFLAMAGKILHEYTHYADRKNNKGKITGQGVQNDNPAGQLDSNDDGIQNKKSYFGHRGKDVEMAMYFLSGSVKEITLDDNGGDYKKGETLHFFNATDIEKLIRENKATGKLARGSILRQ